MKGNSSEMKVAVAALFISEGKESMRREEALAAISFRRRWMNPELAELFIKKALDSGFITEDKGRLKPSFDPSEIDIPFGYYFDERLLEEDEDIPEEALSMDYPFTDRVKYILYLMKEGKDIDEELKIAKKELLGK